MTPTRFISGLLWSGPPGRIIDAAQSQQIELASSTAMLAELECAISANADLIVSGDDDLLVLKNFSNIPIVTAVEALGIINAHT